MENEKTSSQKTTPITNLKWYTLVLALLLGLLLVLGYVISRTTLQPGLKQSEDGFISEKTLVDQYGIRVNLIAVTAAGGFVDLRLKILDEDKARLLLQDKSDVTMLRVGEDGVLLTAHEDSTGQLLNSLTDDGNIFLIFPNVGNAVQPGTPVMIQFGEIRIEPVDAQ